VAWERQKRQGKEEKGKLGRIGEGDALLLSSKLSHLNEVLGDLGDPLLALVDRKVWPIDELLFDLSVQPYDERRKARKDACQFSSASGLCRRYPTSLL
jgi:hypothetical protein